MRKICILLTIGMLLGMLPAYADDSASAAVVDSYVWQFAPQGTNGWYNVVYQGGEWVNMEIGSRGTYVAAGGYPTIESDCLNTGDKDVAFKFVAPTKGMVRLRGEVKGTDSNYARGDGTVASILKGQRELWSSKVTWTAPAGYDITTSVRKGEVLYFVLNKNGNNGFDWSFWLPTVEYLGMEYVGSGSMYKHFEKQGDILTELPYDSEKDAYVASDGKALISDYQLMASDKITLVRRYEVQEIGLYRVFAETIAGDARGGNSIFTVYKNNEKVSEQLILGDEDGTLDVRMLGYPGDTIDVEVKAEKFMGYNCIEWSCNVSKYIGELAADRMITSQGYAYATNSKVPLTYYIGMEQGTNGTEFYTTKYDVRLPMSYNASTNRWETVTQSGGGYIGVNGVYPENKYGDSGFEITVAEDGILKIDGKFGVNDASDGVLIKINHNGEPLWSSRTGDEESVRWDEPYVDSYFNYNVNAVAKVKKGDKLEFTFNKWRKNSNDAVDINNISLSYINGDYVSETTRWKLENSIVIDVLNKTVRKCGVVNSADVFLENGTTYISVNDSKAIFGKDVSPEINLNGVGYSPLRSALENDGRSVVWAADRLVLIHDGIPVMFGWSELSEIKTAMKGGGLFE